MLSSAPLHVIFEAGDDLYAVPASGVSAIVPCAALRHVPGAPSEVAGILNLGGLQVPVVDCGLLLADRPCELRRSTRIIICQSTGFPLGLLAGNVTRVERLSDEEFQPAAARATEPRCAGPVALIGSRFVQRIDPSAILTPEVAAVLAAAP